MSEVVIVSGSGPYADPWHRFAETSARLRDLIATLGYDGVIREDVEAALSAPGRARLLVVNVGNPATRQPPEAMTAVAAGLADHLATGGALLGIHVSSTSFTTLPQWQTILGGRWIRGRSMHPPQSDIHIDISDTAHPITAGLGPFTVHDEAYSHLQTEPDITVLAEHTLDGQRHPSAWIRRHDAARVGYDALGHDTSSFDSPGHQILLARMVRWLLEDRSVSEHSMSSTRSGQ